ncbi:hypothetical protein [Jidongwangia harbinensis]|uniref:hypothetical protein n=1 Tax=Jidongwangia harbinensis TaxID=2878561 RepID=UPI001CDA402E|nr:hypothetical protein [Jidongwangia harbinensis]MCA2215058.1 hypothetical protein [Jidongwangia harbinensis]
MTGPHAGDRVRAAEQAGALLAEVEERLRADGADGGVPAGWSAPTAALPSALVVIVDPE